MKEETERLAAAGVWEKALALLGECSGHTILDAPCGGGLLSRRIQKKEGLVISVDLQPPSRNGTSRVQADMNLPLPFKDGKFDKIVCVEGIEHLENPSFLLKEFSRILKGKGSLVLTTPNTLNIRSRIKFGLTGCLYWFGGFSIKRFGHITPLFLYQLWHFAEVANLEPSVITVNRRVPWMIALSPIFKSAGVMFNERFNSIDLLSGEILILKMIKNEISNVSQGLRRPRLSRSSFSTGHAQEG